MQIFVKKSDGKTVSLNVESHETIYSVKRKLEAKEGIPSDVHTLIYKGEELGNWTSLDYYRISKASTLQLLTQKRAPNTHSIFGTTDAEATATARDKEKELEATISELTLKNKLVSAQCASYESQIVTLKAENKKTKQDLTVALNKEKELGATISRLTHKNKVFSTQCASYECKVLALEAENMKTKEELTIAAQKYYSGGRAAGYAQGLNEGKAKRLKSVEFLHHLTDASMQYFDYGFDSCQKQAEEQGFVGQLNKDASLKEAPELKRWKSSALPLPDCQKKAEQEGFVGQLNKDSALQEAPKIKRWESSDPPH